MPNLGQKLSCLKKILSCLNIGFILIFLNKEAYAENLANIASELSVLEPIYPGDFFVPNLLQKWYVHENFLSCLNMNLHEKKVDF